MTTYIIALALGTSSSSIGGGDKCPLT